MAKKAYVYDGSAWQEITSDSAIPVATTSNTGIVQLVDSVDSTSTVNAAVPNSVKTAYDVATSKAAVGSTSPASVASTAVVGTSSEASRADHVHVGVSGITGTSKQVTASAASGEVTLSIPQYALTENWVSRGQNIATASNTTNISITSPRTTRFTGTNNQTVSMPIPNASFDVGHSYEFINASTGVIEIRSASAATIVTLSSGDAATLTVIDNSGLVTGAPWRADVRQQTLGKTGTPTFGATTFNGTTTFNGILTGNQSGTLDINEGIILQRTSALSIATTSLNTAPTTANTTAITWSSAVKANTSMWTSGSAIVAPLTGYYAINLNFQFGTGTSYAVAGYIFQGSVLRAHEEKQAGSNTAADMLNVSTIIYCSANDSITARVAASTTSKSITVTSQNGYFSMLYLGNQS